MRVNYEHSPTKYKMNVNSGAYTFMSDNEEDGQHTNQSHPTLQAGMSQPDFRVPQPFPAVHSAISGRPSSRMSRPSC